MDTEQLKQGFELQRHDKPEVFDAPLREADFSEHEINGSNYAEFSEEYIMKLRSILGGKIKIYFNSKLQGYPHSGYKKGKVYLNEFEVDYILEELEYYIQGGEWR